MPDTFMHPARTPEERKASPVFSGPRRYFPAAIELVARLCKAGNDKHNPGQPLHWSRGKSNDHADCLERHQSEVGTIDEEVGLDHAVHVAWRALAQLQILAETKYGWPVAPGAKTECVFNPAECVPFQVDTPPDLYQFKGSTLYLYEIRDCTCPTCKANGDPNGVECRISATWDGAVLEEPGPWQRALRSEFRSYR